MIDEVLPADGLLFTRRDQVEVMTVAHRHRGVEFNLVVDGTATYLLDRRRYHLAPGALVWLFPGQDHLLVDASPAYRDWLCVFDPAVLGVDNPSEWIKPFYLPDPPGLFARRLGVDQAGWLDTLFRQAAAPGHPELELAARRHAILAAWKEFHVAPAAPPTTVVHPAVAEAAGLLRELPSVSTLPELARAVGLSPHHLSRLFAQQMGTSITRFRNEQRFRRFLDVYGTGHGVTMVDAALLAGFGSYPQFHRIVRSITGTNPADYLSNHPRSAHPHIRTPRTAGEVEEVAVSDWHVV